MVVALLYSRCRLTPTVAFVRGEIAFGGISGVALLEHHRIEEADLVILDPLEECLEAGLQLGRVAEELELGERRLVEAARLVLEHMLDDSRGPLVPADLLVAIVDLG